VGLRLSMSGGTRPPEEFCVTAGRETAIFSQESRLFVYWHADLFNSTRPGDLESPRGCCELAPREAVGGL
jgi:hypothetical protein